MFQNLEFESLTTIENRLKKIWEKKIFLNECLIYQNISINHFLRITNKLTVAMLVP